MRLIPGQPAGVHDVQLRIDLPPVSNGHGPFFRQLPGRQIERLGQGHGVGKDRAATVQPAEAAVQALYGVGRVHDLPGSLGELEHWADAVPVVAPAVHAAGVLDGPDDGSDLPLEDAVRYLFDDLKIEPVSYEFIDTDWYFDKVM